MASKKNGTPGTIPRKGASAPELAARLEGMIEDEVAAFEAREAAREAAKATKTSEPERIRTREEFLDVLKRPAPQPPLRRGEYATAVRGVHHVALDRAKRGKLAVAAQRAEAMLGVLARLADRVVDDDDSDAAETLDRLWFAGAFDRWDWPRAAEDMAAMGVHDAVEDAAGWLKAARAAMSEKVERAEAAGQDVDGPISDYLTGVGYDREEVERDPRRCWEMHLLRQAASFAESLLSANYPETAKQIDKSALAMTVQAFAADHQKWRTLRAALMTAGIDKSMVSDETLARQVKRWHERRERLAR